LLGDESTAGQVAQQRFVDRRTVELKVREVLGKRQFGDGELIFDRPCLLFVDLSLEEIADNTLGLVLAFDGCRHDVVEGGLHAIELKLAHEVEQFGSFHQMVLLRLS
jgi:hypothetical protein